MSNNQIIILIIVILSSIIVVAVAYLAITLMMNKKKNKQDKNIINPEGLKEEKSLLYGIDEEQSLDNGSKNLKDLNDTPKFMPENQMEPPIQLANRPTITFDPFAKHVEPIDKKDETGTNKFFQ